MKRSIVKILLVIGFMFFNNAVFAEECNEEYLKELANHVDISVEYDYDRIENLGLYDTNRVIISGISQELYARSKDNRYVFENSQRNADGNIERSVFQDDELIVNIYSSNCSLPVLRTIKVKLKKYNVFSTFPECDGLENILEVCSADYQEELTYDELVKEINEYKSSLNKVHSNGFLKFINNNKILIFSVFAVFVILTVTVIVIVNNKKNRLE